MGTIGRPGQRAKRHPQHPEIADSHKRAEEDNLEDSFRTTLGRQFFHRDNFFPPPEDNFLGKTIPDQSEEDNFLGGRGQVEPREDNS